LGDGFLKKVNGEVKYISISTDAFKKKNIENIIVKGLLEYGIECKVDKNNRVVFGKVNAIKFLRFIGECPVDCYLYKWDNNVIRIK
jgi:hypothetical protein